eukprot:Skav220209  [mRNA]  locus=scaffold2858:239229:240881:+ [translate_table: standard]
MVAHGGLRGEEPETRHEHQVLTVGLFDGIAALRVAMDTLGVPVIGHISVEVLDAAHRVVEGHFPGTEFVAGVDLVDEEMVRRWSTKYSQTSLAILGAGPPCQGVSGLNGDRKGALLDPRSCLFTHVPRIRGLLQRFFPWAVVHSLMESVASMDAKDRKAMSDSVESEPWSCNAGTMTWCQRPRLYWITWDLVANDQVELINAGEESPREVKLYAQQDIRQVVRAGWDKVDLQQSFPTFTTSRPQERPGRKPAGIRTCSNSELERWHADQHRFPPYQYKDCHALVNKNKLLRTPDVNERELMLGFPLNYTLGCVPKSQRKSTAHNDTRLTLLGNSWSVPVVAWLLGQLLGLLGLCSTPSPQDVVDSLSPGSSWSVQGRLVRLPLNPPRTVHPLATAYKLAFKLGNLVSVKGEDLMITAPTDRLARFHRLRASVPSKLWSWRIVSGWKWTKGQEHINVLELRAILTTLKWRVEHRLHSGVRLLHLTDSLVCLHCLSRGRSSSRKLRRTLSRINALILVSNLQPVWGYIHTDQNPADKPSRWGRKIRTKFRNA